MATPERRITSKLLLQKLQLDYYMDLNKARYNGRKVAWASSIVPQEFLEVMDVAVAYPENHSAAIAAKGGAPRYIHHAGKIGYSNDICSYARINLAYADMKAQDIVNLPKPNFVVCTNNICNVLIKWYESLASHFQVPFILIDMPYNYEYEVPQERIDYIKAQFEEFIRQLEEICGKKFDYEKLTKVMEVSNRTAKAWSKAMNYASMTPSPLDGFNMFNYMAMMVCMRGKESTAQLYDLISQEMEENIQSGASQFRLNQLHRIMWDGIACWPYLKHNYTTLATEGVIMCGSTYPQAWELIYEVGNLDALAKVYASIGNNLSMEAQTDIRAEIQRKCHCDGVIYHMNRSCKIMDFMQPQMRQQVYEKTQIPFISFDGDQSDPENFSEAQFETRLQALVETMEEHKKEVH